MNTDGELRFRQMMALWEEAQQVHQHLRARHLKRGVLDSDAAEDREEREAMEEEGRRLVLRGQAVLGELRLMCTCSRCNKIMKKPVVMSSLCHRVCSTCLGAAVSKVKVCPVCSTACSVDRGAWSQLLENVIDGLSAYERMVGSALGSVAPSASDSGDLALQPQGQQEQQEHHHEVDASSSTPSQPHSHSHNMEQLPPGIDPEIVFCVTADKMRPYHCLLCSKNFSRDDHLKAHIQQHAGVKPFKCGHVGCEKQFAALDVLWAHEITPHDDLSMKAPDAHSHGKQEKDSKAGVPRARTRRAAADGVEVELSSMTHCNCGFTAVAQGAPCCASEECPCVAKGVVCVACGCRNCKNKKKPRI